jgi:eukaryotic-like serine/threonine-protein kinase
MTRELPPWPVHPGQVLAGKYRVERILGHGGMGVVVSAHHLQLDEKVALKFLLPAALENPMAVARFEREARAAAKIKSEHVARVADVGQLENGAPFMVMEYLEGTDLAAHVEARGRLSFVEATDLVLQACEALAEAHVLGIIHRDLKPSNLFLANRPSGPPVVKVLDFGISKSIGAEASAQLTSTAAIIGSPMFMSPEQLLASKDVTVRSDIWSLGVILYVLVTGVGPFGGESLAAIIAAVMHKDLPPLRQHRPDAPEGFERIVLSCLSKDPAGRFADVGALAAALAPFGSESSAISLGRISHVVGRKLSSSSLPFVPNVTVGAPAATVLADAHVPPPRALAPSGAGSITGTPVSGDAPARPRTWMLTWAAVGVAVAGVVGVVLVALLLPSGHTPAVTAAPPSMAPSAPASSPAASPPPSTASAVETTPAPTVTASAAAPPAPSVGTAATTTPSASALTPKAGGSTHTHKAGSCNPPYTLDAEGHHLYKPECI